MAGKRIKRKFNWDELSSEEEDRVETKKVLKKEDKKLIEEQTKKLNRLSVDSKSKSNSNKSKSNDKEKEKVIETEQVSVRMTRGRKRSFDEANSPESIALDNKNVTSKNLKNSPRTRKSKSKSPIEIEIEEPKSKSAKLKDEKATPTRNTTPAKNKVKQNSDLQTSNKKEAKSIKPKVKEEVSDIRTSISSHIKEELSKRDIIEEESKSKIAKMKDEKVTPPKKTTPPKSTIKQNADFQTPSKRELKEDVSGVLNILPDKNERRSKGEFFNSEESSLPEINVKTVKMKLVKNSNSAKKFNKKHFSPASSPVKKTKFKEIKIELSDEQRDWFQKQVQKYDGTYDKEFDVESSLFGNFRKIKY